MKSSTLLIYFSLLVFCVQAQQASSFYVITKNGKQINCRTFVNKGKTLTLKRPGTGNISVNVNQVYGYYSTDENIMHYMVPVIKKGKVSSERTFMTRPVDGKIQLFREIIYTNFGTGEYVTTSESSFLYALKGESYKLVFASSANAAARLQQTKSLKSLLADNPQAMAMINEDEKPNYHSIIKAVGTYNAMAYQPVARPDEVAMGAVMFYRQAKRKKIKVNLQVGDSQPLALPAGSYQSIRLPNDFFTKICLQSNTEEVCSTYKAAPYFERYFKVSVNKEGEIRVEQVKKNVALFDVSQINRNKY